MAFGGPVCSTGAECEPDNPNHDISCRLCTHVDKIIAEYRGFQESNDTKRKSDIVIG